MKKAVLAALALASMLIGAGLGISQDSQYQTLLVSGTADTIIDSTLTSTYMNNKRLFINGIYWWYDNAANTNQMFVEVVRGQSSVAVQGAGRQFKYSEAMTSGGIKGTSMPMNVTTGADSTIYFVVAATGSDSLFMAINYKFVGK